MIVGAALFLYGNHMANLAAIGQVRLSEAESGQRERRPTVGPVRRHAHEEQNQAAQQRIGAAGEHIVETMISANWLRGSGIVLFIAGASLLLFSRKRS